MSDRARLGFIGIGLMGRPMSLRLLAAGCPLTVWNRSRDKLAPLTAKGAQAADSPAAVALYRQLVAQGRGAHEPNVLVDLLASKHWHDFLQRLHRTARARAFLALCSRDDLIMIPACRKREERPSSCDPSPRLISSKRPQGPAT